MKATRLPQSPWFVFRSTYAALAGLALFLLPSPAPLFAADPDGLSASVVAQLQTLQAEKRARTPAQQKLNTQLIYKLKQKRGELAALGLSSIRASLDVRPDGQVLVDIRANVTDALLAQIKQGGGTVVASVPQFDEVRAWVTLERLEELAARGDVKFIRPAEQAFTNVGPINSQGDTNHRALMARTNFGVSGTGIKVGVLSDSVDFLANSQASNELGAVTVLQNIAGSGEGTAMLEIVHDVAPNAQLYFATAFISPASFAFNILNLWTNGCSVIVDDVGYFAESPFQDDVIARAVNTVTAGGALYFSSAANSGNKDDATSGTWEGDYVDAGPAGGVLAGAGNLHSFGVSNYNTCIAGGSARRADLFWSDALGASANDYDLFVLNATGTAIVDSSTDFQTGTQNPYEAVGTMNVGERIVILKFSGVARFLHLETGRGRLSISTAGNTKGHSAATNAFSVAAVNVASVGAEPPFKGGAFNPVETFSSDGTRRVFYHADGTPITPGNFLSTGGAVRQKPDITAADGGRTSVPGFDPFFGTSAAAPHAAAIAALIRSLNPAWSPAQIRAALTGTALDIEAPGVDRDSGAGIVMAEQALEQLTAVPLPTALDTPSLSWNTGGSGAWLGLTNVTHDTVDAAASALIIHGQETWMESTVTGPGELRFWWKVSSELSFDFLELLVDGAIQPGGISGQVDWVRKTNAIPNGNHTVRFRYRKDGTVNDGTDRGWVDQVSFAPNLIPPVGPTNGGITSILLFVPDNSVPSAFQAALDFAGRTYQFFTDETLFNAAVNASTPSNTLVIVDSIDTSPTFTSLITFVAGGGRSILYYWDLDANAALATAFNVTTITDIFTPIPVNDWGGSAFFLGVTNPLALLERGYIDDGDKVQPTAGGVAVAGYVASPAANQASVVIGNAGRTILNSMALQDATSAPLQAVQFALNEISYLLAPLHTGGRVAVLGAEANPTWNEDVRQKLLATGGFVAVDVFPANTATPTLAQLQNYAGVLAYSDNGFNNSTTLGNNLADYVDGGGVVVVNTFALTADPGLGILGRLLTGGYLPFVPGTYTFGTELTLVANHAGHPILAGVGSLSGGTSSYHNTVTLAPNSALVAHWNNGEPLVMTRVAGAGRVVGLNFFPPSETVRNDMWRTNSAGGLLMANALRWNSPTPIPPVTPTNGGIASILLFVDNFGDPSPYQSALDYAGLSYQLFTVEASFNAAVFASNPLSTLVIVDSTGDNHDFSSVISFVANSGRAIVYHWDLDQEAALAAAFNASTVQDIFTPVPVHDWGGSFFFAGVSTPLSMFERGYNDDGDKLQPTPGGLAVAGHTASPAGGQASVVIGNSGRTILNSMALQDATGSPIQAAQFAMNEIFYLLAPGHGGGRVAVIGAEQADWNEDVRQKLLATGAFEAVDVFQADSFTPTLAELQPYSAVLVYSDGGFNDATSLGNVLANYVDAGGGVVLNTFALYNGINITGRLLTGGYLPFVAGAFGTGNNLALVPDQAVHPILAGVGSLVGGTSSYHAQATLAPNSALVAHWNNGVPLVMTKVTGLGRVVGLNFFPVSETKRNDFWRTNTAGARLMANALRWSAVPDCTSQTNYTASTTFTNTGMSIVTISLAFDGTNFWAGAGGNTSGIRLARYTPAGLLLSTYSPGIDFRSLFADAGGRLYARGYNTNRIMRQTTPGTFVSHVILSGGSIDAQGSVVLNDIGNEYLALTNGLVQRWSTNGTFLGTVALAGFGTVPGEIVNFQNVHLVAAGNNFLTYNGNRTLSIWSQGGTRLATTTLALAGTGNTEATFTLSYCAGQVFICDGPTPGLWRGYDICTAPERFYLSNPVRLAGGQFQLNLHATPARSYAVERSSNFLSWVSFTTNLTLAPNTTITDPGSVGRSNLVYRARTQ